MNLFDNRKPAFPPSPYRPIVSTLTTVLMIQAVAIVVGFIALAMPETSCI